MASCKYLCDPVPHRRLLSRDQKLLPYFRLVNALDREDALFLRFDRRLLGELPRLTWQTVLEVYRAVIDRQDVMPGMIAAIHTFGELLHWHPHIAGTMGLSRTHLRPWVVGGAC